MRVAGLTGGYAPGAEVLTGVEFALEPGTIAAVLGPNGGGKTTLFRALLGDLPVRRGVVELEGRPALQLTVRDNGPGLDAEQREKVFDPFFTTKAKGTGLGMAIARRIVEAHGGQIAVGDAGIGPGAADLIFAADRPRLPAALTSEVRTPRNR